MNPPSKSRYVPALAYNWLTPYYDAVVRATTREQTFKQALIHQARLKPGQQVLDLACGTGTLAVWVKQHEPLATVVGVDGDPSILAIAKQKAADIDVAVQFDHGLSHSLPYPDGQFDRALSSLFFHHLTWADKRRAARELFRVLRPGAELHVADWGRQGNAVMRTLFVAIQLLDGFENTADNASGRLVELFQWAGFSATVQRETFNTVFGTLALYSAYKSG